MWSVAEDRFIAKHCARLSRLELTQRVNRQFHRGEPIRSYVAICIRCHQKGLSRVYAKSGPSRAIAAERLDTAEEIAKWERDRRARETVQTPAIPGITRAQLMAGRA